jgi:hypothetical protein
MNLPDFLTRDTDDEIRLTGHRIGLYTVVRLYREGKAAEQLGNGSGSGEDSTNRGSNFTPGDLNMPLRFVLDEHLRGGGLWWIIRQHNTHGIDPLDVVRVGDPPDLPRVTLDPEDRVRRSDKR